jgi:hypothetical protein
LSVKEIPGLSLNRVRFFQDESSNEPFFKNQLLFDFYIKNVCYL